MRVEIQRAKDRRRMLVSSCAAFLAYALIGLSFIAAGILRPEELGRHGGPIKVRLGSPEGLDEISRTLPKQGLPASAPPPRAVPQAQANAAQPAADKQVPSPAPASKPNPETAVAKSPPVATTPKSASPVNAQSAPQPTSASPAAANPPAPQLAAGEGIPGGSPVGSGSLSIKGSEQGNSFETSYESGSGKIGRSLYVPIYLYMPLPTTVPKTLYDAIPSSRDGLRTAEIRKVEFRSFYELSGDSWKLRKDPAPDRRPSLWLMLKDAGYALSTAEYKAGKALSPVVLSFKVGPAGATGTPTLEAVSVTTSSGSKEIDEAVVFGFSQAAFFNDGQEAVTGRFSYDFTER